MATIHLDKNTYFDTALRYANKGAVTMALRYFAKCDSYEAWLNRVLILYLRGDYDSVNYLIGEYVHQFEQEYNSIANVMYLLESYHCDALHNVGYTSLSTSSSPNRLDYDQDKIVSFDDIDDMDIEVLEDSDEAVMQLEEMLNSQRFMDINSLEYQHHLELQTFLLHSQGKTTEANKVTDQLLAIDSPYLSIKEWQIYTLCNRKNYYEACKIAQQIYLQDIQPNKLVYVLYALCNGGGEREEIQYCVNKLVGKLEELLPNNIEELMTIANNNLHNCQLARQVAEYILDKRMYFGINSLKSCVAVFLNNLEVDKAKECCSEILAIVPEDNWAMSVIECLPELDISNRAIFAHFVPPVWVSHYLLSEVIVQYYFVYLSSNIDNVDDKYCRYFIALTEHSGIVDRSNGVDFFDSLLQLALHGVVPSSHLVEVTRHLLRHYLATLDMRATMLYQCVQLGDNYHMDIHLQYQYDTYSLDTSLLGGVQGRQCEILCALALVTKLDEKLVQQIILAIDLLDDINSNIYTTVCKIVEYCDFCQDERYYEAFADIANSYNKTTTD